jgi:hypothetical protein
MRRNRRHAHNYQGTYLVAKKAGGAVANFVASVTEPRCMYPVFMSIHLMR